jgi:hypothetical protein
LSLLALGLCVFLHDWTDFLTIFLATGLVLVAELFNTALEAVCDYLSADIDERIRLIKDVAPAAVGVSIVVWGVVLLMWFDLTVIPRFFGPWQPAQQSVTTQRRPEKGTLALARLGVKTPVQTCGGARPCR